MASKSPYPKCWHVVEDPRGGYRAEYDGNYSGSQLVKADAEAHAAMLDRLLHVTNEVYMLREEYEDTFPNALVALLHAADEAMDGLWDGASAQYYDQTEAEA